MNIERTIGRVRSNQTFQNFFALAGAEEETSGTSMLPATTILGKCCFTAFSDDMEYIFRVGND